MNTSSPIEALEPGIRALLAAREPDVTISAKVQQRVLHQVLTTVGSLPPEPGPPPAPAARTEILTAAPAPRPLVPTSLVAGSGALLLLLTLAVIIRGTPERAAPADAGIGIAELGPETGPASPGQAEGLASGSPAAPTVAPSPGVEPQGTKTRSARSSADAPAPQARVADTGSATVASPSSDASPSAPSSLDTGAATKASLTAPGIAPVAPGIAPVAPGIAPVAPGIAPVTPVKRARKSSTAGSGGGGLGKRSTPFERAGAGGGENGAMSARDKAMVEERLLLQRARGALTRGDHKRARALLRTHLLTFPGGIMKEERDALRIKALLMAEENQRARFYLERFRSLYSRSMLLPALERAIESSEGE